MALNSSVLECLSGWANWIIHSIGEASEAQKAEVTGPRSYSKPATDRFEELEMSVLQMWGLGGSGQPTAEGRKVFVGGVRSTPFPSPGLAERKWLWPCSWGPVVTSFLGGGWLPQEAHYQIPTLLEGVALLPLTPAPTPSTHCPDSWAFQLRAW